MLPKYKNHKNLPHNPLKAAGISLKSCRSLQLWRNYKIISFFGKNQTIQTVKWTKIFFLFFSQKSEKNVKKTCTKIQIRKSKKLKYIKKNKPKKTLSTTQFLKSCRSLQLLRNYKISTQCFLFFLQKSSQNKGNTA